MTDPGRFEGAWAGCAREAGGAYDDDLVMYPDMNSVLQELFDEQGRIKGQLEGLTALQQRVMEGQVRVLAELDRLHGEFERLAQAVLPLVTRQYAETLERIRVLETRVRNRQERPLIVRMANLLSEVRRIESEADVKAHVEDSLADALVGLGYQETGSLGDQFDPDFHEPMSGSIGKSGKVTRVYARGLSCYGDVLIKARVDVEPVADERVPSGSSASTTVLAAESEIGEPLV